MNSNDVSQRYHIPIKILKEYESWGLCGAVQLTMEEWQYDDRDLEHLSMIMALHDMGFSNEEVEGYMRLILAGESSKLERLRMLNEQRNKALDEIHLREQQLMRMDYLRKEIRDSFNKK